MNTFTSAEDEHGNPLQYSCLENPMDGGPWRATVHRVAKSWTQLSDYTHTHTHTHTLSAIVSLDHLAQSIIEMFHKMNI